MTARLIKLCVLSLLAVPAACTSTDVLEPSAIAKDNAASPAGTALSSQPSIGTGDGTTSAIPNMKRLQFAPIIGTPVEAATPLSERLTLRARERGFAIAGSGDSQSLVLKGYFSALPEGKETTVVYVWDVLDSAGNRLHRIQGQQTAKGGAGWDSVPAATMKIIADQTIDQLGIWLGRSSG